MCIRDRRHWLKRLLCVLFFMSLVPILNSAFQLFNSSYYARWFYMLTLMMTLATLMSLENVRVDWKRAIRWTAAITLGIALPIGLMPKKIEEGKEIQFGLMNYPDRFWIYVAISMLSLLLLAILIGYLKKMCIRDRLNGQCLSVPLVPSPETLMLWAMVPFYFSNFFLFMPFLFP